MHWVTGDIYFILDGQEERYKERSLELKSERGEKFFRWRECAYVFCMWVLCVFYVYCMPCVYIVLG